MTTGVAEILQTVREIGVCVVPGVLSDEQCKRHVQTLEKAVRDQVGAGSYFGSNQTQVLYNYFVHGEALYDLFAHPLIDEVMTQLIDKDYVLVSPSARNPFMRGDLPAGRAVSGEGWHVDSRVANAATGELIRPSLSYYAVFALEPFTEKNSATKYIPGSHRRYQRPPNRNADISHSVLTCPAGSMIVFDSALWHRTGTPTPISRWSVFNMYGPWYMKPYFRFAENFTQAQLEAMPPRVQKLLHLLSTPPVDPNVRTGTVTSSPVFECARH